MQPWALCCAQDLHILLQQEHSSSLLIDAGAASAMQHFHCVPQLKLTVPAGEIQVA